MDAALPPDRPVSRHMIRNTVLALFLGFMLTAIAALSLKGIRNTIGRETGLSQ
jgi:uncharacterized protein involved in exopolysaccharide biosynthesis